MCVCACVCAAIQVMYNEWKGQQGLFQGLSGGFSDLSPISPRVPLNIQAKVLAAREELLMPGAELFCGDEDGIPCDGPGCDTGRVADPNLHVGDGVATHNTQPWVTQRETLSLVVAGAATASIWCLRACV